MITPLWPVHPQILPGEILSSWMVRIAHANGLKPYTFYAHYLGRHRELWTRDIDHLAPDWLITALGDRTGASSESIRATTLRSYEGIAFERMTDVGATRWILSLGVYHRTRRAFGQQYCPVCLATDAVPYLRLRWRLALSVICTVHGVLLLDRCGKCGRPLAPHRADPARAGGRRAKAPIRYCGHCGGDLAGPGNAACSNDIELQRHIDSTLQNGYCVLGESIVYSHRYFDGLHILMIGIRRNDADRQRNKFERLGMDARLDELRGAYSLLQDWPSAFIKSCGQWRQPYSRFLAQFDSAPWWLWCVLRRRFYAAPAPTSAEESSAMLNATERVTGRRATSVARKMFGRKVLNVTPRAAATEDDVDMLIAAIDHQISRTSRGKRNLLIRDKVMLLVARREQLTLVELASRKIARHAASNESAEPFWDNARAPGDVEKIIAWYSRYVRPILVGGGAGDVLFVSHDGREMTPNAIGARYKRAASAAGLRCGTWSSWRGG